MSTCGWEQQRGSVRCSILQRRYPLFQVYLQDQRKLFLLSLRPNYRHYKCHHTSSFWHRDFHYTWVGTTFLIYPFSCRLDCRLMLHAPPCLPSCRYSHQRFPYGSLCTRNRRAPPVTGYRGTIAWTGIFIFFFSHTLPIQTFRFQFHSTTVTLCQKE